ncbi:MAG: polyprenol monophosphomannose synthase [Candidatus Omnitrophica bacterium]|nr:polyprenol monophosphomannose synthase [Candidatus Omnitrophota bacterium]MDD5591966.1 polyprenol monophosphomannose synthase [Candidatus Omnitrophota bacterium]
MKIMVVIPTYNEKENIAELLKSILALEIKDMDILVVDDDSPDRTAKIVEDINKINPGVHLLLRKKLKGRGAAGKDGFRYALDWGADYIIEMDADFSHDPKYIPDFLEAIKDNDVVLGSRFIRGGRDMGRTFIRRIISWLGNVYVRRILGIKIHDCSSGYRCFRRKVLETINLDNTISLGPAVVHEFLYKSILYGFRIKEIPIIFVERKYEHSKLNFRIILEGFLMVLVLKFLFSRIRHE